MDSGCALNEDSGPTPASGCRVSSGSGRQPKKTAGRKPGSKTVAPVAPGPVEVMRGELGAALVASDPSVKAKRSKATPVVQRAPSMRADAKLGDIMSLESAKLRAADKNMDVSGNPIPSFRTLNAFADDHLVSILNDSGVAVESSTEDIISLVRAREEAQAALATAAAARCAAEKATAEQVTAPVGAGAGHKPNEGDEARAALDAPSSSRVPARKRVAKA